MNQPTALCHALVLALTAPTDEKSHQAIELAKKLAIGLSKRQVSEAKRTALEIYGQALELAQ